ncbi:Cation efflux system protein CusF precursor [Leminorella richardii]|uniref:Cation efflux system protein CusF n=1 Tax=Leminorella richardii TaxID=158841 RepID=A0A2X4U8N2_9GAMM|nr:copper-binding protein [Leminorella richardii]SQI36166.1 Cation efflux system protein CusF precursor [Leminorella richardii]
MKNIISIIVFTLFSSGAAFASDPHAGHGTMPQAEQAGQQSEQVISTQGEVKGIDADAKKLTVAHEPIPSLGWPAMTMRFTYEDPATVKDIKVGDKVKLDFIQRGPLSHIVSVSAIQ